MNGLAQSLALEGIALCSWRWGNGKELHNQAAMQV